LKGPVSVELSVAFFVILLMLLANGVFAAYEMALAAMSQARLEALRQAGAKGAAAALFMKQRT
jgi:CBS domain containing-hemolysin-like protein